MLNFLNRFKSETGPAVPTLYDVTIGRAVEIEEMAYKLWPDDCLIELASPTLSIVAQGHCDLGEGAHLHRFYPDDDSALLQMQGGDGFDNTEIEEIVLWTYLDVSYPSSETTWKEIRAQIRQPQYELPNDGPRFERAWFGDTTGEQDPITYWETVHDDLKGKNTRRIFQTSMLYGRTLSDGSDEMLLVNIEEPDGGDRCLSLMVGRSLTRHQLRA